MTNSGDFSFGEEGSNYESHEKDSQIFDKFNEEYQQRSETENDDLRVRVSEGPPTIQKLIPENKARDKNLKNKSNSDDNENRSQQISESTQN